MNPPDTREGAFASVEGLSWVTLWLAIAAFAVADAVLFWRWLA